MLLCSAVLTGSWGLLSRWGRQGCRLSRCCLAMLFCMVLSTLACFRACLSVRLTVLLNVKFNLMLIRPAAKPQRSASLS